MTLLSAESSAVEQEVRPARPHKARRTASRKSAFQRSRDRMFFPFVAPAFILYAIFLLIPVVATAWISLHKWPGAGDMEWRGVDNYVRLVQDPLFTRSFINTLILLVVGGVGTFLFSFILMMILRNLPGRKFARAVIFFPIIVPAIALSILWGFLFQADGLVNSVLRAVGVEHPPEFLAKENLFAMILLGIIWTSTGFYTTILMAAVDRIPKDLYEDCELAGAGRWQVFWNVTIPLSWDVVGVCAVLWTINSVKTFEFILAMAGAAGNLPPVEAWTAALYAYAMGSATAGLPNYGMSAANSVVILALVGVLVVSIRRLMQRDAVQF